MRPARGALGLVSERQWQRTVREYAEAMGWRVYAVWRSDHSPAGWPDLALVRPPRLVFAELKSERGRPTPAQLAWLEDLRASGAETHLWRPSDWDEVQEVLR